MEGLLAAGLAVIFILGVICIAYIVFYIIGMVKLYKKCGRDGWMAIVPFYNVYILTEIAGLEWYWFLMAIAPTIIAVVSDSSAISGLASLVSTFAYVNIAYNLAKKMHKDTAWGILTGIFSGIMFPIIGFMNSLVYDPNVPVSKNGFFDSDKVVGPQPGPMGPQPGPMGPQSGPMGPQPGPMGPQPGPMGPQSGPMGPQPGPMGPQPGPMGPQPGTMGPQSGPMGPQSGQVQNQPTDNNINNF